MYTGFIIRRMGRAQALPINPTQKLGFILFIVNAAEIILADIPARNLKIHEIQAVVLP
jgi:hypothetical protein